jgi:CO dehydrogenase/acetyl-CoA synthase gamma subunit (corrinoid Fe-S protein)
LNLKLLLTWGASVGGLVMPLDNFIRSGRFDITDEQVALLLVGVACTYFYDNENALKKILSKIKEEGLEDIFKEVLLKGKNLKDSFTKFIKSSKVTINSTLDIITYAFLIPIITDIQSLITSGEDIQTVSMKVAKRLVASGVVLVGQVVLTEIIKKIIKKLS